MAKLKGADAIEGVTTPRDPGVSVPEGMWADAEGQAVYDAVTRIGDRGMAFAAKQLEERQGEEDSAYVSTATTRYQTKARELLRKMQNENSDGAKDFTKKYIEGLKGVEAEVNDEMAKTMSPSTKAMSAWKTRAQAVNVGLTEASSVWEDTERKRFYFDATEKNIDQIGIAAGKGEITRDEALRRAGAVIADSSRSLTANDARDLERKALRIVSNSYYMGLAERDPGGTLAMIKRRSADEFAAEGLKPEDMRRIEHTADATIRRNQHSAVLQSSMVNDKIRTWMDAKKNGVPGATLEALEKDIEAGLGTGKNGAKKIEQFNEMRSYFDKVDQAKSLTVPELRNEVAKLQDPANNPSSVDIRTSLALSQRIQKLETEGAREFKTIYSELSGLALKGEDLPKSKLDRMREIGKSLDDPEMGIATTRLNSVSENIAKARRTPLSGAEELMGRLTSSEGYFGEAKPERDTLAVGEEHAVRQAFKEKVEERNKDPRAYIERYYPEVGMGLRAEDPNLRKAAVDRLLQLQAQEGVLTGDRVIMSKPEAAEIEARINQTKGKERADIVMDTVRRYGAENWTTLQRQFDKGKDLPPDIKMMVALPWGEGRDQELYLTSQNLAEAFDVKGKNGWKDLGIDGPSEKSMNESAVKKMAPFQLSMAGEPGGAMRARTWTDGVQELSKLYKWKQGLSDKQAIDKAYNELFGNFYDVADRVRVPRRVDGMPTFVQGVRAKMDFYATADVIRKMPLDPRQYTPTELSKDPVIAEKQLANAREQFVQSVALKGYWANTPDGMGFRRFNDQGAPVVLKQEAPQRGANGREIMRFMDHDFYAPPYSETDFWNDRRWRARDSLQLTEEQARLLGRKPDGPSGSVLRQWPQKPTAPGMVP